MADVWSLPFFFVMFMTPEGQHLLCFRESFSMEVETQKKRDLGFLAGEVICLSETACIIFSSS